MKERLTPSRKPEETPGISPEVSALQREDWGGQSLRQLYLKKTDLEKLLEKRRNTSDEGLLNEMIEEIHGLISEASFIETERKVSKFNELDLKTKTTPELRAIKQQMEGLFLGNLTNSDSLNLLRGPLKEINRIIEERGFKGKTTEETTSPAEEDSVLKQKMSLAQNTSEETGKKHKREIAAEKKREARDVEMVKKISGLIELPINLNDWKQLAQLRTELRQSIGWQGLETRPELKAQLEERIKAISDRLDDWASKKENSRKQKKQAPEPTETTKESAIASPEKEPKTENLKNDEQMAIWTEEDERELREIEEELKRRGLSV